MKQGESFDIFLLVQPLSPLRDAEDIRKAAELFWQKNAAAVVSVCETEHSPLWMNTIGPDLCMKNFLAEAVEIKTVRNDARITV